MNIREKKHRLSRECYQGMVVVSFTACILNRIPFFLSLDIVDPMINMLSGALNKNQCVAVVYTFMPDHLHTIIERKNNKSNTWKTMVDFKQQSGHWLRLNHPTIKWQKDFYNHIVRQSENLDTIIRYLLENPVRKGLVED
jgi:putative transposase